MVIAENTSAGQCHTVPATCARYAPWMILLLPQTPLRCATTVEGVDALLGVAVLTLLRNRIGEGALKSDHLRASRP